MPRDFEALYRAQAQARTSTVQNETISLPPGYLVGYDVRLRQDYTVLITAGAANIGGRLVQITEDHQLADADWVAPKINSSRHYYIYLSAAGQWFVDIVAPVWNNQYLYYEQPDTNWRAVGKIFLADGQIIFGIKEVEKNEQTVTVAPAGFTGKADYYCTGTDDQILINAAIRYLHEAYDGGTCLLLPGEFSVNCDKEVPSTVIKVAINNFDYDNITISGSGYSTIINIKTSTDIAGSAFGKTLPDATITYNGILKELQILSSLPITTVNHGGCGVRSTGNYYTIIRDLKIRQCKWGLIIGDCVGANITSNTIDGEVSGYGRIGISVSGYSSSNERARIINNTLINLSDTSAGPNGISVSATDEVIITDNTINTITAANNIDIISGSCGIRLYNSDRNTISNNNISNVKNTTTAIYAVGICITTLTYNNKVTGNYCYNNGSDTGIANTNGNNFYDGGTDTQVYSNSWQQPVAGEPTQGELKWLPQSTSTLSAYFLPGVTTTAAWSSVSLGSLVPVGTKSIYCQMVVNAISSAAGLYRHQVAFSNDSTGTPTTGTRHLELHARGYAAAGGEQDQTWNCVWVPITSDRKFYHYAVTRTNATSCILYGWLGGYSI